MPVGEILPGLPLGTNPCHWSDPVRYWKSPRITQACGRIPPAKVPTGKPGAAFSGPETLEIARESRGVPDPRASAFGRFDVLFSGGPALGLALGGLLAPLHCCLALDGFLISPPVLLLQGVGLPRSAPRSGQGREAAKRTLDGEDRSGIIQGEGKGCKNLKKKDLLKTAAPGGLTVLLLSSFALGRFEVRSLALPIPVLGPARKFFCAKLAFL